MHPEARPVLGVPIPSALCTCHSSNRDMFFHKNKLYCWSVETSPSLLHPLALLLLAWCSEAVLQAVLGCAYSVGCTVVTMQPLLSTRPQAFLIKEASQRAWCAFRLVALIEPLQSAGQHVSWKCRLMHCMAGKWHYLGTFIVPLLTPHASAMRSNVTEGSPLDYFLHSKCLKLPLLILYFKLFALV